MCLQTSNVDTSYAPNWEGDEIQGSIVLAARNVPGTTTRYDIDLREYLTTASNAVVRREIDAAVDGLPTDGDRAFFWSRRPGSFDHRVRTICHHLSATVRYQRKANRGLKEWLFPDETIASKGGDCEDHAFLLAAMILASGVSGYVVRVALGRLANTVTGNATDHAWVMYKNESGHWLLLDPLIYTQDAAVTARPVASADGAPPVAAAAPAGAPTPDQSHEYIPHFVLNDTHLWAVRDRGQSDPLGEYINGRTFWTEFDPSFAAGVHNSMFDRALAGMSWTNLQYVKAVSLAADVNLSTYDPRDHFDNAYISDAWAVADERLAAKTLNGLGLALHAIGDFYAHSSWGVFGERKAGKLQPLLNHASPTFDAPPDYGLGGRFPLGDPARFSVNEGEWKDSRAAAAAQWKGRIISGRYAQSRDPHQGTWEKITYIPKKLLGQPDYHGRTGLPHHNEIAVDDEKRGAVHGLYVGTNEGPYVAAFNERVGAAVAHLQQVYAAWGG